MALVPLFPPFFCCMLSSRPAFPLLFPPPPLTQRNQRWWLSSLWWGGQFHLYSFLLPLSTEVDRETRAMTLPPNSPLHLVPLQSFDFFPLFFPCPFDQKNGTPFSLFFFKTPACLIWGRVYPLSSSYDNLHFQELAAFFLPPSCNLSFLCRISKADSAPPDPFPLTSILFSLLFMVCPFSVASASCFWPPV